MPISYSADITPQHAVDFLWVAPALPAAAAAVLALGGRALERRFGRAAVGGVLVAALGATAGIALAAVFGVLPRARLLVDARGALAEVGGVRIAATLTLNLLSGVPALAIALAGAIAAVACVGARQSSPGDLVATGRSLAAAVAGGLLLVLSDDLLVALVGWEALVLGSLALVVARRSPQDAETTRETARALVVSRVGQAAWLSGIVLLLWGLTPPGATGPRVVLADAHGGAGIEMPTLGDRPPAASLHRVTVGPTLSFGEIATQLGLRDSSERSTFQVALAEARLGPLPLLPFIYLGLLFGAALLAVAVLVGPPSSCVAVAVLAGVAGLLGRLWPLFALSALAQVAVAGVGIAAIAAWLRATLTGRTLSPTILGRAARELGIVPVRDFARGAAWLERRVFAPMAQIITIAAGVVALVILFL